MINLYEPLLINNKSAAYDFYGFYLIQIINLLIREHFLNNNKKSRDNLLINLHLNKYSSIFNYSLLFIFKNAI